MMGFERRLRGEEMCVRNGEVSVLCVGEFCMVWKEKVVGMDEMRGEKVGGMEGLLGEYWVGLGMWDVEVEGYLKGYYEEKGKEKEF